MLQLVLDSDTLKTGGGANSKTARIGSEGQKVLDDTKAVLRALKAWGDEKNDNDLLQNFFVSLGRTLFMVSGRLTAVQRRDRRRRH
jgi:hypothetical protein